MSGVSGIARTRAPQALKIALAIAEWPGTIVILEFPDVDTARAWYTSPGYQEILPLRTRNIEGDAFVVKGVEQPYSAAATAAALRAAAA